ncbi:WXG100 family type VII secretion target [Solwaraspora sp. WMMD1047]|uniref:WXG100 family type VII secretion target n=1 Tax=Solwaraspora sp. WMMD1047 TaxID=3016102 RepID=UPI002416BD7D|nr:WXG100 family type VII secretion target [Solwaraspora sp. WMMD1047]MDG4829494.1 WXG100 family type VII secretion target [Solwaraspora sp. WMMD1047]
MAGTGFQSDAAAMARAISGFDESAANVAQTMRTLENELMGVLARYSGSQAQAFWQLHTRLQESMRAASQELNTMSSLVSQSRDNYNTGDSEVASSLTTLSSSAEGSGSILSRLAGS